MTINDFSEVRLQIKSRRNFYNHNFVKSHKKVNNITNSKLYTFLYSSHEWIQSKKSILNSSSIEANVNILPSCKLQGNSYSEFNKVMKEESIDNIFKNFKESNYKGYNRKDKSFLKGPNFNDRQNHHFPIKGNHNIINSSTSFVEEKANFKSKQIIRSKLNKNNICSNNYTFCYLKNNKKRIGADLLLDNYKEKMINENPQTKNIFRKSNCPSNNIKIIPLNEKDNEFISMEFVDS